MLDYRPRQRMLAAALQRGSQADQIGLSDAAQANHFNHLGRAFGQRPGLVDHHRGHRFQPLQRLRVADQHTMLGTTSDADHDRHRRRQPQRTGASNDQHADCGDQAIGHRRLRSPQRPADKRQQRHQHDSRHKPGSDPIHQPLNRGPAALGAGHHADNLRQHGVVTNLVGAHDEGALAIHAAADYLISGGTRNRHRFARHHGLVDV